MLAELTENKMARNRNQFSSNELVVEICQKESVMKIQLQLIIQLRQFTFQNQINNLLFGGCHFNFWFCRNPGLALPLIALQYHEVKLILNFATLTHYGHKVRDYVYLDTDERHGVLAQQSHEYLIEQVQEQSVTASIYQAKVLNLTSTTQLKN